MASDLEVDVVCYFEYDTRIVEEIQNTGANVKTLKLSRRINVLSLVKILRKVTKANEPDFVHIQYMAPGALPILSAKLAGVKTIYATVHQPWTKLYGYYAKIILRVASLLTKKFVSVSLNVEKSWFGRATLYDENKLLKIQPHHFTIHNAIDILAIQRIISETNSPEIRNELNIPKEKIVIGAISRLRHEKGIDLLIDAFSLLTESKPGAHLLIVGTGPDIEILKKKAKESSISSQVTFYGDAAWERAMELLSVIDIVVVPSRFEGFGLTAAEAMAAGKTVIASDTYGLKEIVIDNVTGFLFRVDDSFALMTAMEILISNPQLRISQGKAGTERVKAHFSTEIFGDKIKALYDSAS
jgi:glycosyltransferase involved in cell wall biosynthesis